MAVTKIRSKWVSGLLEFFGITSGDTVLKITESGIEANVTGDLTGNVTGSQKGAILGSLALSKADNYALTAAEKANFAFSIIATAGSKTITLGLAAGQVAVVYNAGDTNAFTLKNIAADTGTSIVATKVVIFIASATANASTVIALN